jgi:hypothetical protein
MPPRKRFSGDDHNLSVPVPEEVYRVLEDIARVRGLGVGRVASDLVRSAVRDRDWIARWLVSPPNPSDRRGNSE